MKKLPDHLSRECIIAAIRAYDAGVAHQFKSARLYEIEFEGRRYPSKAIVGLAATLATGTEFTPADFSGGIKSKCVRLLLEQGFTIASQGAGDDEAALFPD
ncbi:HNH endonuclease, partial [Klebsiella pneumoniae]|nr:HNH endonuclease [Klebsiella pneumoniae]